MSKVYVTGGGKFPTLLYSEDTSGNYGHSYDVSWVLIEDGGLLHKLRHFIFEKNKQITKSAKKKQKQSLF